MLSLKAVYSGDDFAADPVFTRLKERVIALTGLAYYADKDFDLARRIGRRMASIGLRDWGSYLDRLGDPSRGSAEMEALIAEITIGESSFFRHREHFDALRDIVIPDLIGQNPGMRRLRIWSAGCADGAEVYSLSILLRRDLSPLLAGWEISILGTDMNRRCLEAARDGQFEEWSFRGTAAELRHECFEVVGRSWMIRREYRTGVSFRFHNLVEDRLPPPGAHSAFDLIVCRNVMIYFDPERMRRLVGEFHDCLAPGGWLLVGPSEPNMTHFHAFQVVNAPGVTLYRRPAPAIRDEGQQYETQSIAIPPAAAVAFALPPKQAEHYAAGVPHAPLSRPEKSMNPASTLEDLRRSSDSGDWGEAARHGKELLQSDNLNPAVHFNYALVMEQMGNQTETERALRRAIYLDRRTPLAHYRLGLLLKSRGEMRPAMRSFENALNLLTSLPPDRVLPDADGITAAELSSLVKAQIAALREWI